jgi:predicted phage terminase large subunit-like protein
MNIQQAFDMQIRHDFPSFLHRCFQTVNPGAQFYDNWHIEAIAAKLANVQRGDVRRLIINMPPRYLKSLMVSIAFPAYLLGHNPRAKNFVISYGAELADKYASDFKAIVTSGWYRRAFPQMRIARSHENEIVTTQRGFRKSTTVMGALTGLGGDLFIIDDPQKAVDVVSESKRTSTIGWFTNTLLSRLDNKEKGAIIIVMQRVHLDDLSGHLIGESDDWDVLSLAAIAEEDERIALGDGRFHCRRAGEPLHPERESLETIEALRRTLGSDIFAAQMQQRPVPEGGALIKKKWVERYDHLPEAKWSSPVFQSWDTASKEGATNDWSVCTTWLLHEKKFYLWHVLRARYDYPTLRAQVIAYAGVYQPQKVLIEDAGVGTALIQELKRVGGFYVIPVKPERDKLTRMSIESAKFESGQVLFPHMASWLPELEAELFTFPQSRHDDQVDSISQALAHSSSGYDTTLSWVSGPY